LRVFFAKRISASTEPLAQFYCSFVGNNVSSLYEATKNELQGSGMALSLKKTNWVLKVTDFELIVISPTSTLKLKSKIDLNYLNMRIEL
jgi:hypothetical protein